MDLARQVTEAYRLQQLHLGARAIAQLEAVWELLDPEDLDGSFPRWLAAVQPIIDASRNTASQLAAGYLTVIRTLSIGAPGEIVRAQPVEPAALATSMLVTGPVSIRGNVGRMPAVKAIDIARGRTAAAGFRHVLNGGRETITSTIQADRRAVGYERVTSGSACEFCNDLADRGAVYSEESADFAAHDGCGCTAEPVYR